jgi:NADPH:quinone reductase-like Zn-dependent oxidoreductase
VRATCLNFRDLSVARGVYGRGGTKPRVIPLSDGAGEVASVGPGVTRVKPGDRVCGIFMQRWLGGGIAPDYAASAMGGAIDGMLAEDVVLHEDGLVHIPAHLSFEEAATLPCAAVTAWHGLDAIREATSGRGVDHVVEVGGAGTLSRSMQAVRMGGKISMIGVLTGGDVSPTPLLRNSIGLQGIYVGSREMFEAMNRAIAAHEMRPVIDKIFAFADAKAAYRHLEGASHFGKVVISHGM